ncbi:MAG TPA: GNAT family N-acetyltransferase [Alphaproteobacteria bacterium]|nr:GNAT family N-acetyltransferase [Alphaproteobacteria bacterium]
MNRIETERLVLRPLAMADHAAIQKHFPHWEIVQHLSGHAIKWPYPADGAQKFLQNIALPAMARGDDWYFGITEKGAEGDVIGVVHLRRDTASGNRGVWLASAHQGKGYMKEAVAALNDYAFAELGFEKLVIKNAEENVASRRLKEKTGARLLQTRPADHYLGGCKVQEIWELTAADWYAYRAAQKLLAQQNQQKQPHPWRLRDAAAVLTGRPAVPIQGHCQPNAYRGIRRAYVLSAAFKKSRTRPLVCKPCPAYQGFKPVRMAQAG